MFVFRYSVILNKTLIIYSVFSLCPSQGVNPSNGVGEVAPGLSVSNTSDWFIIIIVIIMVLTKYDAFQGIGDMETDESAKLKDFLSVQKAQA